MISNYINTLNNIFNVDSYATGIIIDLNSYRDQFYLLKFSNFHRFINFLSLNYYFLFYHFLILYN